MSGRFKYGISVPAKAVRILQGPSEFYSLLCGGMANAQKRISFSSPISGDGAESNYLLQILHKKQEQRRNVHIVANIPDTIEEINAPLTKFIQTYVYDNNVIISG